MKKKLTLKKRKFGINNKKIKNWFIPNELNFSYCIFHIKYKGRK